MSKGQTRAIVDKLLTQVSNAYIPEGYVSESVLPNIPVVQTTGKLGQYGQAHLRITNTVMGGKGKARRVDTIIREDVNYHVENHGLESEVSPDDYRNVEDPFDAEQDEVVGLTTMLWLGKEKSLADTMGNTAVMTQNKTLAGGAQLDKYSTSNPLAEFRDAHKAVKDGSGVPPNAAVMSWEVFNSLKYHPGILEALGYKDNRAGLLTKDDIARAMDVRQLFIGEPSFNSAKDGQSSSLGSVWGKNIIFYVRPQSVGKYQVSLGYYLTYRSEPARKVHKFPVNNPPGSTGLIVTDHYDMLIGNAGAGYLIKDAIA